jgi:hypothetical protein
LITVLPSDDYGGAEVHSSNHDLALQETLLAEAFNRRSSSNSTASSLTASSTDGYEIPVDHVSLYLWN